MVHHVVDLYEIETLSSSCLECGAQFGADMQTGHPKCFSFWILGKHSASSPSNQPPLTFVYDHGAGVNTAQVHLHKGGIILNAKAPDT